MDELNGHLSQQGILELVLVDPKDCIAQRVNARYFTVDKFKQMVANIRKGGMESVPLLYQDDELKAEGNKFEIISGHHRIDAAKEAGITLILAMVSRNITRQELVSKQLAHNALVGVDDKAILKELFDSLEEIDLRMASGLSDEIAKVSYESLNFKVGTFKSLLMLFVSPDLEDFNNIATEITENSQIAQSDEVMVGTLPSYDLLIEAIQKIKKVENIKNNAVALHRIARIAIEQVRLMDKDYEVINQEKVKQRELDAKLSKKKIKDPLLTLKGKEK